MRGLVFLVAAVLFLTGCGEKDYLITIKTEYGDIKAVLYDKTPVHKENFVKLAKEGFYDSLLWHRVMQNFMIQGGDNLSRHAKPNESIGRGGAPYRIPAEIFPELIHKRGTLAAARMGDNVNPERESNGSQFYIVQGKKFTDEELDQVEINIDYGNLMPKLYNLLNRESNMELRQQLDEARLSGDNERFKELIFAARPIVEAEYGEQPVKKFSAEEREIYKTIGGSPHLDGGYTVFGEVIDGIEVVDKIAGVEVDARSRPRTDTRMWIEVESVSRSEITKEYGYVFPPSPKK